jgi:hypothetical protein
VTSKGALAVRLPTNDETLLETRIVTKLAELWGGQGEIPAHTAPRTPAQVPSTITPRSRAHEAQVR